MPRHRHTCAHCGSDTGEWGGRLKKCACCCPLLHMALQPLTALLAVQETVWCCFGIAAVLVFSTTRLWYIRAASAANKDAKRDGALPTQVLSVPASHILLTAVSCSPSCSWRMLCIS